MRSFTQKMNVIASSVVRGEAKPRHATGGAPRKGWAFRTRNNNNKPSAVRSIPVEQYLATR